MDSHTAQLVQLAKRQLAEHQRLARQVRHHDDYRGLLTDTSTPWYRWQQQRQPRHAIEADNDRQLLDDQRPGRAAPKNTQTTTTITTTTSQPRPRAAIDVFDDDDPTPTPRPGRQRPRHDTAPQPPICTICRAVLRRVYHTTATRQHQGHPTTPQPPDDTTATRQYVADINNDEEGDKTSQSSYVFV